MPKDRKYKKRSQEKNDEGRSFSWITIAIIVIVILIVVFLIWYFLLSETTEEVKESGTSDSESYDDFDCSTKSSENNSEIDIFDIINKG